MSAPSPSRFLIRCDLKLHQVALDPGRYWQPVKCPVCRAPIDQFRLRRGRKYLVGQAPRSGVRIGALRLVPMEWGALLWLAIVVLVTLVLHTVADAWWPGTILLFLGRWPWLLPAAPLLLLALGLRQWRAVMLTLATVVIALFGIMEFSLGTGRFFAGASDDESRVRVITFNMHGDESAPMLPALILGWEPDILAIQECGANVREALRTVPNYQADVGSNCMLTKYAIVRIDSLRRDAFEAADGAGWVKRYRLKAPHGEFDFTNMHLDTPRKGFEELMDARANAIGAMRGKTEIRDLESKLARRWVDQGPGPRLVAGDFNMPTESAIYRRHWSDLQHGFETVGFGFGYTRLAGWIRLRIDHVLADDGWVVKTARVLPDYGSDHLPMMVEVERATR